MLQSKISELHQHLTPKLKNLNSSLIAKQLTQT
jgi:hypothetical protein